MGKLKNTIICWCYLFAFNFIVIFVANANASNAEILKTESLKNSTEYTGYADSLMQELFNLVYKKPDSARSIAFEVLNSVDQQPVNLRVRLLNIVGISYHFQANYGKALEYYYYALERAIEVNDSTRIGNIYNNLGLNSLNTGNYKDAYDFFLKALEQYETLQQVRNTSSARHNIGLLFLELNNFERAKEHFHLALAGFTEAKDSIAITNTLNNIGAAFLKEGEYGLALDFFFKIFPDCKRT